MSNHRRNVSRRRFLTTGAGVGTALVVPGLLGGVAGEAGAETGTTPQSTDMSGMDMSGRDAPDSIGVRAVPFTEGLPLVEPELRRSAGGELRTTLQVRYAYRGHRRLPPLHADL